MTARDGRRWALGFAGVALFFGCWELAVRAGWLTQALVPAPSSLPATFWREVQSGIWFRLIGSSLTHYWRGLVIGSLVGILVGTAVAMNQTVRDTQAWLARVLRPIPPLAWIPFAIVWFGISDRAAAFIIGIGVFWINYFAALGAISQVDPAYDEVARVFGHRRTGRRIRKVVIPAALPGMLTGLRTGVGMGWMTVVAAELFGIAGIGQRMMEASGLLATEVVVVYMLTIALLYGVTDLVFSLVQKAVLAWMPSSESTT